MTLIFSYRLWEIQRGYVTYLLLEDKLTMIFILDAMRWPSKMRQLLHIKKKILLLEICSVQYVFTVWLLMYFVHNVSNSWMLKFICRMQKPKNWRLACQTTVGTPDSTGLVRVCVCVYIFYYTAIFCFNETKLKCLIFDAGCHPAIAWVERTWMEIQKNTNFRVATMTIYCELLIVNH